MTVVGGKSGGSGGVDAHQSRLCPCDTDLLRRPPSRGATAMLPNKPKKILATRRDSNVKPCLRSPTRAVFHRSPARSAYENPVIDRAYAS